MQQLTKPRPKFLALNQIRQPLAAIASILHRLSGAGTGVGVFASFLHGNSPAVHRHAYWRRKTGFPYLGQGRIRHQPDADLDFRSETSGSVLR